jgi:hypothetical protein
MSKAEAYLYRQIANLLLQARKVAARCKPDHGLHILRNRADDNGR